MVRTAAVRTAWRRFRQMPPGAQAAAAFAACLALWVCANALVQIARKPTELFFPVSGVLDKMPGETWREYGATFREHSTEVMTPGLLAALAQAEGAGNPLARAPWRWRLAEDPFDVYRPSSTAVGMYQITDGTLRRARQFCIHRHRVAWDGPWYDWRSCWFNALYFRVLPSHAAEMTSGFLDHEVGRVAPRAALREKQDLAAVMHLCGVAAGVDFARNGFRPARRQRCGGQDVAGYLAQVRALQRSFDALDR
ncbi:MAG: hypothetical protein ACREVQ_08840 [Burkholderiales bacterium]